MADNDPKPIALMARDIPPRTRPSNYPEPFRTRMLGRKKRIVGDLFGLKSFGVNLTTLDPGGESALLHRHTVQDEFILILEGHPTLVTDAGDTPMAPGMCAGFPAAGVAHQLVNRTDQPVLYLEVGDRQPGDAATYPADDLTGEMGPDGWIFAHKDGSLY